MSTRLRLSLSERQNADKPPSMSYQVVLSLIVLAALGLALYLYYFGVGWDVGITEK
jgi:hypothetical protein